VGESFILLGVPLWKENTGEKGAKRGGTGMGTNRCVKTMEGIMLVAEVFNGRREKPG